MMRGRWKTIGMGVAIVIFSIVGLWEYLQMNLGYDVPQVVVIMPIVGAAAAVVLRRYVFLVPVCTAALSVVYQMVANVEFNQIVTNSKFNTILNILPYIIIFELVGIAGGFLIRVLINGRKPKVVGVICCICGIIVTFAFSIVMFGDPLYPFVAKHQIASYAEKYESGDYKVSRVVTYYSIEDMEYQGRVMMSDGVIYILYHSRETGEVTED